MSEATLERHFAARLLRAGALHVKLKQLRGWPDRLVIWPPLTSRSRTRIDFVELKAFGLVPRPLQLAIHRKLATFGITVEVLDSKEAVAEYIDRRTQ